MPTLALVSNVSPPTELASLFPMSVGPESILDPLDPTIYPARKSFEDPFDNSKLREIPYDQLLGFDDPMIVLASRQLSTPSAVPATAFAWDPSIFSIGNVTIVPEPASAVLVMLGLLLLGRHGRQQRK